MYSTAGPMTYGAAFWPQDEDEEISKMGFDGVFLLRDMPAVQYTCPSAGH